MATARQRRRTYLRRRAHALRIDRRGRTNCSQVGWFPSVDHLAVDVIRYAQAADVRRLLTLGGA